MSDFISCPHCSNNNVSRSFGEVIPVRSLNIRTYSQNEIEYICNDCECIFICDKTTGNRAIVKAPLPANLINEERNKLLDAERAKINYIPTILCGIITIALFIYCSIADFTYQEWHEANWLTSAGYHTAYNFGWLLWALLCIIFFIVTLVQWGKVKKQKSFISTIENMTNMRFMHMFPFSFLQYEDRDNTPSKQTDNCLHSDSSQHVTTNDPTTPMPITIQCPICAEQIPDNVEVCPFCNEKIK